MQTQIIEKQAFVFIYSKDGEIQVLNLNLSKLNHESLVKLGWKHTATLDACVWIKHLYTLCKDECNLIDEVKSLTK